MVEYYCTECGSTEIDFGCQDIQWDVVDQKFLVDSMNVSTSYCRACGATDCDDSRNIDALRKAAIERLLEKKKNP